MPYVKGALKRHIKEVHKRSKNQLSQSSITSKRTFQNGVVREVDWKCEICGEISHGQWAMNHHRRMFHDLKVNCEKNCSSGRFGKLYKCEFCNKDFFSKVTKKMHVAFIHKRKETYQCDICEKTYTHSKDLRKHFREEHTKAEINEMPSNYDNKFDCNFCGKTFKNLEDMYDHTELHYGIKPLDKNRFYTCEFCQEKFTEEGYKKAHIAKMHKKTYQCDICEKECQSVTELRKHFRQTHTEEYPIESKELTANAIDGISNTLQNQKCDSCDKEFCQEVAKLPKDSSCNLVCKMNQKIARQNQLIKNLYSKIRDLEIRVMDEDEEMREAVEMELDETVEEITKFDPSQYKESIVLEKGRILHKGETPEEDVIEITAEWFDRFDD